MLLSVGLEEHVTRMPTARGQTYPLAQPERLPFIRGDLHLPNKTKTDAYEFLCIQIPREIIADGRVQRTTSAHSLDSHAAQQLRKMLRESFIRTFLDFETRNNIFAKSEGIHRSNVEILERFFMEYDLPVSHSQKERESLRHLVQRWRKEAEYLKRQPRIINDELVTRIDEHEYTGGPPKYDDDE